MSSQIASGNRFLTLAMEIVALSTANDLVKLQNVVKPDLILLAISLPKLNGIEASRRIRQLSPNSKIVFLSQNNDPDFVLAALSTGAKGYVHKTDAQGELLPALDAVLGGKQFVSSSLKGGGFIESSREKALHRHEVQFYSDDTILLDRVTPFIAAGLKSGNAAIVVATKSNRDSLLQRLKAEGVDTDGALQAGTYISWDAADMLSRILVKDLLDPILFFAGFGARLKL